MLVNIITKIMIKYISKCILEGELCAQCVMCVSEWGHYWNIGIPAAQENTCKMKAQKIAKYYFKKTILSFNLHQQVLFVKVSFNKRNI